MLKNQEVRFKRLDIKQILNKYSFSQRFVVGYAVACAKDASTFVDKPDPRSLAALTVTEAYMNGEATLTELVEAKDDAYAAAYASSASSASYAAAYSAYAAYAAYAASASSAAYASSAASAAANAAYAAYAASAASSAASSNSRDKDYYRGMLIDMINELPLLERIILGVD